MKSKYFVLFVTFFFFANCFSNNNLKTTSPEESVKKNEKNEKAVTADSAITTIITDAATILAKKQVPVLCYHHIREAKPGQSETFKSYSVSPSQFASQMKALKDSGYETVLPDQLYNYLAHGTPLPPKPVMLTFDDTDEEQFSIG